MNSWRKKNPSLGKWGDNCSPTLVTLTAEPWTSQQGRAAQPHLGLMSPGSLGREVNCLLDFWWMWGHTHWKRKFPQRKTGSYYYTVGEWMLGWQRPDKATVSKTEAVTIEIANHRADGGPVGRGAAIQISPCQTHAVFWLILPTLRPEWDVLRF